MEEISKKVAGLLFFILILGRIGNASKALDLITEHASDVDRAVEFCKKQNDSELLDKLINKSIHKPSM